VTSKFRPAITSLPVRCFPVFVETPKLTLPLPVPLVADVIESQEDPDSTLALQPQLASLAVIVTVPAPAASGKV
jgi:hypothetical protein